MFSPFILTTFLLPYTLAQSADKDGNCISGKFKFDANRITNLPQGRQPGSVHNPEIDISRYDFTLDYGFNQINYNNATGAADIMLVKNPAGGVASGIRLSTLRYMKYGKIKAKFTAPAVSGIVTTFITMSDIKDEIDWEIVGKNGNEAQSNVFYKGIEERGVHGGNHPVADVSKPHEYVIDWNPERIIFEIDGKTERTFRKSGPEAVSKMSPGVPWYPTTPSLVQISLWESQTNWAGGPINWGSQSSAKATYEYIEIQCYDDSGKPVDKWPANTASRASEIKPTAPSSTSPTNSSSSTSSTTSSTTAGSPAPSVSNLPKPSSASTTQGSILAAFMIMLGALLF